MTEPPPDNPAIAAAFLDRYLADLDADRPADLAAYQALFPGHDAQIAREFERVSRDAAAPETIAHYTVVRELGRGGQGVVYLARDENLGREVALKVLPDHGPLSAKSLARFRREAEITARLDHPHICTVLDSGRSDGVVYIAMRYVPGESLADRMTRLRATDAGRAEIRTRNHVFETVRLFERICRAVHTAHEAGVVHRDLKPANILLTRHGDPVVLDFGLAHEDDADRTAEPALTRTGEVFGTPWYMSPEQLRGSERVDARADVYALGASLYECVTGQRPIEAASREALYRAILETPARDPRQHDPKLPRDLCSALTIALEKDPSQRYATAADFADDLGRIARFEPIVARPPSAMTRAQRWVQRNRTIAALAFALFVVMLVGLVVSTRALLDSERARGELAAALDDIRAGKASKRAREIESMLLSAYQAAYSADPRRAPDRFEAVLAMDPTNVDAIAGRVWLDSGDAERALETLERFGAAAPTSMRTWMRAFFEGADGHAELPGDADAMRVYWHGLRTVGGFAQPVSDDRLRAGFALFRRAALRSDRPRFHHFHSMMMTAARLGDVELLDECAANLAFHWPDDAAMHEATAQFYLPIDRDRAVRSLRRLTEISDSAAPHCGLGYAAMMAGDDDAALQHFSRALVVDQTFVPAWVMRAGLHERNGRVEHARADYRAALALEPEHFGARAALDRIGN